MSFRFPLAAVLRLREIEEEREERLLGQVLAQLAEAQDAVTNIEREIEACRGYRAEALQASLPAAELTASYMRLDRLAERLTTAREQEAHWRRLREAQLAAYQSAHQRRELLVTMRVEQQGAFVARQARLEQKALDDLFLSRRRPRP